MPRVCTVCKHAERESIDRALIDGESLRYVSKQYNVSYTALFRHKRDHLPATMVQAQEAAEVAHADSLLDQVKQLQVKALKILADAELAGDLRAAVGAIREARGNIELLAKLTNELPAQPTVNILVMPEWVALRTKILLWMDAHHPDEKVSLAEALDDRP
jgi:hypothetical protein